ncbi:AAEL001680-PA [Aedes aegypti]|uniref:AAEL001680-PA n=1 Tax=Aedes aegypti TaxID=7159 RepID=Q17KI5_AEDAE|nr:AAEL001680-PA [Aedes aegypti]
MADEWETPSRRTLDFLAGSGGSSSRSSSPSSSFQHIPAYNYFDGAAQQYQQSHYQPNPYSSNKRSSATKGQADRNYRHKMLERAAYANRSFMHHNEYDPYLHQEQQSQSVFPRGGAGYGGGFVFATSHYPVDPSDRRSGDRRRHSLHHIAQLSALKMDDLKQRFDEYSSSAAVGRGGVAEGTKGGAVGRNRRSSPRRQQNGSQFIVGGGGRLVGGYSGSKSLDTHERTSPTENGGSGVGVGSRLKGTSAKTPKRGSRSSQGSTDSSHSSHSASSGSLLLTVANLENFAKIHKKQESSYGTSKAMEEYLSSTVGIVPAAAIMDAVGSKYNNNITMKYGARADETTAASAATIISIEEIDSDSPQQQQHQSASDEQKQAHRHSLPSFHRSAKTKDPDSVSMASSTHFTMVNGVGGPQRLPKGGICSRGHQITILIVTMSIVFMVGICAAVFFLESDASQRNAQIEKNAARKNDAIKLNTEIGTTQNKTL